MTRRVSGSIAATVVLTGYAFVAFSGYLRDKPPSPTQAMGQLGPATVMPQHLEPGALLIARNTAIAPVALDRRHLVWETWPREGEGTTETPRLVEQDLRTRRKTTLARGVDQFKGLASTPDWVVYATADGSVVGVRHDASGRVVFGSHLATSLASRGEFVAWGEDNGARQRVVVRNMGRNVTWLAADMPRCENGHCYRIDGVTLSEQGVVYARGSIGAGPSLVARRRFSDSRPETVALVNDPQPDLAPSSAGALYHALAGGWFRWDFDLSSPQHVPRSLVPRSAQIVAFEGGTFFLHERRACNSFAEQRRQGEPPTVVSPARLRSIAGSEERSCVFLVDLVPNGSQPVTAWIVVPKEDPRSGHEEDEDYAAVVLAGG